MTISIINGSPRKNGATAKVLREIGEQLKTMASTNVIWYDISDLHIDFCIGCETCYSKGECTIKMDNFENVSKEIKKSDGIIIGSPTHGSNVSALLKNFMDRGHFIVEQSLYNKKCMSVVTYEIADGRSTLKILNKFFRVSGGVLIGNVLIKTKFNSNPINEVSGEKLKKRAKVFYNAIKRNKRKSLYNFLFNDVIVVNMIWKPYFRKNKLQYQGILEKYKEYGIHKNVVNSLKT